MNTFRRIFGWIRAIIIALWTRGQTIAGATTTAIATGATATGAAIAAFIYAELIILGISLGLCLIGFILNLTVLIWISAMVSAIAVFTFWISTDTAIRLISDIAAKIPVVGKVVNVASGELKKLLPPFLLLSLVLAFIATVSAVRGPGYYTWTDLMVFSAVALFIGILSFYLELKVTKATGWAMLGYVAFLLVGNYLWPIQVQGTLDWLDRKTIKRAVVTTNNTNGDELVIITNNKPLYKFRLGKFHKETTTTATETVAKIISRKNDPVSKEPMYEVILPVAENLYVGGEILYVPARLTKLVYKEVTLPLATPAVYNVPGKTLTITLQPEEIYKVDELKEGQNWRYLSFNGAFSHRVDKGDGKACWKVVDNNLPWSAGWNGKLEVKGGNTPATLTVNIL